MDDEKRGKLLTDLPSNTCDYTLKERVFLFMERYPNNKSNKDLCTFLNLDYYRHRDVIKQYKSQWRKSKLRTRQGLNCLNFHNVRFWNYMLKSNNEYRVMAVLLECGWIETKAKNGMIIWKDNLGRIEWFKTGRLNCWIKKPASKSKMVNLLCNAFFRTGIIQDVNVFNEWKDEFKLKGFHVVKDTGVELPYCKIGMLKDSNGVILVMGDKSHKTGLEVQVTYPDWIERNEKLFEHAMKTIQINSIQIQQFSDFMQSLITPKPIPKKAEQMFI